MRFLLDTQLPRTLAALLAGAGHEVEHVLDRDMAQSPDNDLWRYAIAHQAIIVAKDEDFTEWVLAGRRGPAVVWLRIGSCARGCCRSGRKSSPLSRKATASLKLSDLPPPSEGPVLRSDERSGKREKAGFPQGCERLSRSL